MVFDMARWEPVREVLLMDGVALPERLPFVDSHDRSTVDTLLGSTVDLHIQSGKLLGKNVFSNAPEGERAWQKTKEGHLTSNSIGYQVESKTDIEPGKTKVIKGRTFTADKNMPLRVSTKWRVVENSAVIIGADNGAVNRELDNRQANKKCESIYSWRTKMNYEKWLQDRGIDIETLNAEQRSALEADFKAFVAAKDPPKPEAKPDAEPAGQRDADILDNEADRIVERAKAKQRIQDEAVKSELDRQKAIRELAGKDIPTEVVDECIESRKSVSECQGIFLKILQSSRSAIGIPAIQIRESTHEKEDYEAALLLRAGFEELVVKEYGEKRAEKADRIKDLCLHDLCMRSLILDGKYIPVGRDEMIRTAFSTVTLPYILGAVANKAALAGYRDAPATWRKWCSIGSVSDFKTNTRVRMTDAGELGEVNNAGEVPHGGASEEAEQFAIATYAKQFAITRQNIINDDLGAFTKTPQTMGRKAGLLVSKLAYTHLLANGTMGDGAALFVAAGHVNLNTSSALTSATLSACIQAFRQQTDSDGQPIDVEPAFLLIPPELETTAKQILQSDSVITTTLGTEGTAVTFPNANIFKGSMEPIVETRLSNSNYTGYSATSWYVTGRPTDVDTIEVAFLNGNQNPTVERFEADPGTMGIIYRVYLDCGVKALDWRGMQKNNA